MGIITHPRSQFKKETEDYFEVVSSFNNLPLSVDDITVKSCGNHRFPLDRQNQAVMNLGGRPLK